MDKHEISQLNMSLWLMNFLFSKEFLPGTGNRLGHHRWWRRCDLRRAAVGGTGVCTSRHVTGRSDAIEMVGLPWLIQLPIVGL